MKTMYFNSTNAFFAFIVSTSMMMPAMQGCSPTKQKPAADAGDAGSDGGYDASADASEGIPVFGPIAVRPERPVLPAEIESCAIYRQTRCEGGLKQTCGIYDGLTGGFTDSPDPHLEQIFWFDRYYDLYNRMEGQQAEFHFTKPMPPGTPESVWSAPDFFQTYIGHWDSAGWTGTALQAAAARYLVTGTEADYGRMLDQFEAMMFMHDATGAPGLLMRCHYAMLEEGAPDPIGHPGKALIQFTPPANWEDHNKIAPDCLAKLPSYYTQGVNIQGKHYKTTPKYMGHASRDMYVRSLPGIMLAYDLLGAGDREDALKASVKLNIPCILKRLKKMRIRNIQRNEDIRNAVSAYLGTDRMKLDPGDIDPTKVKTLMGYVMEEPYPGKEDKFNPACPETVPMGVDPYYDLDAVADDFIGRFMTIMLRVSGQGDVPIAWILFPSVRGSDILFMTQWALAGHYLTGEAQYLEFVERLQEETDYWPVINTMGSFWSPKWCRPYYGSSLTYPTFWNIQNRVDRKKFPGFWTNLGKAVKKEFRLKELAQNNDAYFGILYDTMVDGEIDPDAAGYAAEMAEMLRGTGQYQAASPFEPHRSYNVDLLKNPPAGFSAEIEYLTQEQKDTCLKSISIFGMEIKGYIDDELPRAVMGLPLRYRFDSPFQWQEDPFLLFKDFGGLNARTQWPPTSFSVAYWTGRMQGTIKTGGDAALGWRATSEHCGP